MQAGITSKSGMRAWLRSRGKKKYIDFDDRERRELRKYFLELDEDKSGSITIDELEEPLIGLGLAENRFEVERMISKADIDASGYIDFDEFLLILKTGDKNDVMSKFFKDMVNGELE